MSATTTERERRRRTCAGYETAPVIRARLEVLYEKANRIIAYNRSLDPGMLDSKQWRIMRKHGRRPGSDTFPKIAHRRLGWTIDLLQSRLRRLGGPPVLPPQAPVVPRRLSLRERFRLFMWRRG